MHAYMHSHACVCIHMQSRMRMHHLVRAGGAHSAAWTLLFACAQCIHGSVQCVDHVPRDGPPAVQCALTCMHMWCRWAMYPGMGHRLYNMLKGRDIITGGAKRIGYRKRIWRGAADCFDGISVRRRRIAKAGTSSQLDLELDAAGAISHSSSFAPAILQTMTAELPDIPAAEPAAKPAPEGEVAEGDLRQRQKQLSHRQQQEQQPSNEKVRGCPYRWPCCCWGSDGRLLAWWRGPAACWSCGESQGSAVEYAVGSAVC